MIDKRKENPVGDEFRNKRLKPDNSELVNTSNLLLPEVKKGDASLSTASSSAATNTPATTNAASTVSTASAAAVIVTGAGSSTSSSTSSTLAETTWTNGSQPALTSQLPNKDQPVGEVKEDPKTNMRRVGFEFETAGEELWQVQGLRGSSWTSIVHTKATLLTTGSGLGELSADNGHVEFRTTPLSTSEEVETAMKELMCMVDEYKGKETELTGDQKVKALAALNAGIAAAQQYTAVKIRGGLKETKSVKAVPQMTMGIRLSDIPALLTTLVSIEKGQLNTDSRISSDITYLKWVIGGEVTDKAQESIEAAKSIYEDAVKKYNNQSTSSNTSSEARAEIVGLLTLIIKTLWDAWKNSKKSEDMKTFFPLMPRTDFRSMFMSMQPQAQRSLAELWGQGKDSALYQAFQGIYGEDYFNSSIFPDGYQGDNNRKITKNECPQKEAWFNSIIVKDKQNLTYQGAKHPSGTDLLSPAPGYNRLEGFGAKGVDGSLVIIEFRGLGIPRSQSMGDNRKIVSTCWRELATALFKFSRSPTTVLALPTSISTSLTSSGSSNNYTGGSASN